MSLSDNKIRVNVILTKELKKSLEEEAKQQGRSLSNYINLLIEKGRKSNS